MGRLDGKVAIVTGGAMGIGRGTTMLFAREGAKVVVADIDDAAATSVVGEIRATGGKYWNVYYMAMLKEQWLSRSSA